MNNKTLLGGLAGGVAFFFLGWLLYGMLMADFMAANLNQCNALPMTEMKWWAIIASNLVWGYFLALIFGWTGTSTPIGGLQKGALLGLLISLSFNLSMFSMTTNFLNLTALFADVAVSTLMSALGGAVIGYVMGMGKTEA